MAAKKFYLNIITLKVLSEDEPLDGDLDVKEIAYEIDEGACVGNGLDFVHKELSGKETADLLREFGSEPGFFQLDDDGNPEKEG
jgi:hypothetical protein